MAAAVSLEEVRTQIRVALAPAQFFVAGGLRLEWEHGAVEEVAWEIFQGRLLDAAQTREQRRFEAWNVWFVDGDARSAEPLVSVKLDTAAARLFVVRAIHSYAWEGFHAGDNVYLSREIKKWVRELVGDIDVTQIGSGDKLRHALQLRLTQAVAGLSRLPLTSVETPLPAFTLGQLAYFPLPSSTSTTPAPMRDAVEMIGRALTKELAWPLQAKLLEAVLRATPADQLADAADRFVARWRALDEEPGRIAPLLRTLFDDVALSPYTDFVDKTLRFVALLEERGHWSAAQHADFLGGLLRQLVRHLTAFDLVTFHHRGANYPDALLLDAALTALLDLAERQPALFTSGEGVRLRRRAVRQAILLRLRYEGHAVPDLPTSPGENSRVLPPAYPRVPEEQITDPGKRHRKLFDDDPLLPWLSVQGRELLRAAVADLDHPAELQELGLALFLDRPLGIFKRPGEPDATPLLSYETFSRTVAHHRLQFLRERLDELAEPARWQAWPERLTGELPRQGLPLKPTPLPIRPGVASLADAVRVADDFVLLRTTRRSADEFLACYDWAPLVERLNLDCLASGHRLLIVGGVFVGKPLGTVLVYDDGLHLRVELVADRRGALRTSDGIALVPR